MRQPKATYVAITLALAFLCVLAVPYPASGPARDIEPSDGASRPTPSPSRFAIPLATPSPPAASAAPTPTAPAPTARPASPPGQLTPQATPSPTPAAAARPNIIVIYVDDVDPHDGRLWSDPDLTPTLEHYFVAHGTRFENSIGETPLCCPGRVGLLTGLHTHHHGVLLNQAALMRPDEHVGSKLKAAGYATMFIGKYLNQNNGLTDQQWDRHAAGWTVLDAIRGPNGSFYDYQLWTKSGTLSFGAVHSTRMVAERTVAHLRETPADVPVFAILSVYNAHTPNVPMPEFANDRRCDGMPPWRPPSFNEADVSDKPPAIRGLPLLDGDGWPMSGYCREMLGVEWLTEQVTDELGRAGRLDNTLLVFTADNGVTWGAHRMGQAKRVPYATSVPLLMWWPSVLGDEPRVIDEAVSNIDLGPTLCAMGGCTLGPYPTGQDGPDGISLVPLLDGSAKMLDRGEVLESSFDPDFSWFGLRTSPHNPLGHWHYVEWADGFVELYDLAADPWELDNLAADAATAELRSTLRARLAQLLRDNR